MGIPVSDAIQSSEYPEFSVWLSYIGFHIFIFNWIIWNVINMPYNFQYNISFDVVRNNYEVPLLFVPLILIHRVAYFVKHLTVCSLSWGDFPAYTPVTMLHILLNGQHMKHAVQVVIQYQGIIYLGQIFFFFCYFLCDYTAILEIPILFALLLKTDQNVILARNWYI